MNAKDPTPSQELHSREALAPAFAELNKYDAPRHFIGQGTVSADGRSSYWRDLLPRVPRLDTNQRIISAPVIEIEPAKELVSRSP